MVRHVGSMLTAIRGDATLPDFFSSDSDVRDDYAMGLLYLGMIVLVIVVIWTLTLLVLKIKGKDSVGCASGHAFQTDSNSTLQKKATLGNLPAPTGDSGETLDDRHRASFDLELVFDEDTREVYPLGESDFPAQPHHPSRNSPGAFHHPSWSGHERDSSPRPPPQYPNHNYSMDHNPSALYSIPSKQRNDEGPRSSVERNKIRQGRTRLVFWFVALLTLFGCFLLFSQTYVPFLRATNKSSGVASVVQQMISSVESDWGKIVDHANKAKEVVENDLPTTFETLCPGIPPESLKAELGVDLGEVVSFVRGEFGPVTRNARDNTTEVGNALDDIRKRIANIDDSIDSAAGSLWVIPLTAVSVILLTAVFLVGVLATQTRISNPFTEGVLSWIILPIFIWLTLFCWTYAAASMVGSSVSYDFCVSDGSPEHMMQEILLAQNVDSASMTHRLITAYTTGCLREDPIEPIVKLQEGLMGHLEMIRTEVLQADEIGISFLQARCGQPNQIEEFFDAARLIEADLTVIHGALVSISDTLSCSHINELYRRVFHDAICTDVASACASGFILFLVVSVCCSILISLRASWLQ